jgi:hypothetical protein
MLWDGATNHSSRSVCILWAKSQFRNMVNWDKHLHRRDIGWTPYMRLLVLGTPGFDDVADVSAFVLHLCIVAHDEWKEKM